MHLLDLDTGIPGDTAEPEQRIGLSRNYGQARRSAPSRVPRLGRAVASASAPSTRGARRGPRKPLCPGISEGTSESVRSSYSGLWTPYTSQFSCSPPPPMEKVER